MTQQVDIIIENGTILTMDSVNSVIENGFLCIMGIPSPMWNINNKHEFQATKVIDANGGLILPGLLNGHTHAAMSLFRGLADDLPLMEWLTIIFFPWKAGWMGTLFTQGPCLPAQR